MENQQDGFLFSAVSDPKLSALEIQLIDIEEKINYSMKAIPPLRESYLRCMQIFFSCEELFQDEFLRPIYNILKKTHSCLKMVFCRLMQVCESTEEEKKFLQTHFQQKTKQFALKRVKEQNTFQNKPQDEKYCTKNFLGGITTGQTAQRGIESTNNKPKEISLEQEIQEFVEQDNKVIRQIDSYLAHQHQIMGKLHKDDLGVKLHRILEYFKQCQQQALSFINSKEWDQEELDHFSIDELLLICDESNQRLKEKLARKAAETVSKQLNDAALKNKALGGHRKQLSEQLDSSALRTGAQTPLNDKSALMKQKRFRKQDDRRESRQSNQEDIEFFNINSKKQQKNGEQQNKFNIELNRAINQSIKTYNFTLVPNIDESLRKLVRSIMSRLGLVTKESKAPSRNQSFLSRSSYASRPSNLINNIDFSGQYYFQHANRVSNKSNQVAYAFPNNSNSGELKKIFQNFNQQDESDGSSYSSKLTLKNQLQKCHRMSSNQNNNNIISDLRKKQQRFSSSTTEQLKVKYAELRKHRHVSHFKISDPQSPANTGSHLVVSLKQGQVIKQQNNLKNDRSDASSQIDSALSNEVALSKETVPFQQNKITELIGKNAASLIKNRFQRELQGPKLKQELKIEQLSNQDYMDKFFNPTARSYRPTFNEYEQNLNGFHKRHDALISVKKQNIVSNKASTRLQEPQNLTNSLSDQRYQKNPLCSNLKVNYSLKNIIQKIKSLGVLYRKYRYMNPSKELKTILKELSIGLQIFNYSNLIGCLNTQIQSHNKQCNKETCTHFHKLQQILEKNMKAFEKTARLSFSKQHQRGYSSEFR